MQVFKTYFKLLYRMKWQLLIYLFIFLGMAILFANLSKDNQQYDFSMSRPDVSVINRDGGELSKSIEEYINEKGNIIPLEDNKEKIKDSLFNRSVEYVLIIPEGFSKEFLKGKNPKLESYSVPNSSDGVFFQMMLNKYLNTANLYLNQNSNMDYNSLITSVEKDLSREAKIEIYKKEKVSENEAFNLSSFFNFMSYAIFSILILGVSGVMITFSRKELRARITVSSIKSRSLNFQLILGNIVFAIGITLFFILVSFGFSYKIMLSLKGLLFSLNILVFTLAALSISFLIANLVKKRNSLGAVSNVIVLGTSFISGIFIPQEMLGGTVLNVARFAPPYWYAKSSDAIYNLTSYNMDVIKPIFFNMLVLIVFAAAFLMISVLILQQRRKQTLK